MKISRRSFVHGACTIAAVSLRPNPVEAWFHGMPIISPGHSVLNANFAADQYLNIAKGFTVSLSGTMTPASLNADQYPTGIIPNTYGGNTGSSGIDPSYFGHYTIAWTGVSAFTVAGKPVIIYNGGTFAGLGGASGVVQNNVTIGTTANPSVELAVGALITSVTTSGGGLVQFGTTTGFWGNFATGTNVKLNNLTGLPAGPNADGSWTATKVDNQTFTLNGSAAFAGLVSINTSGTVGVNTEAIASVTQFAFTWNPTFSAVNVTHNFSNFIFCNTANLTDLNAGLQLSRPCIATIKAVNPRYVRFMDAMATQGLVSNFASKAPSTSMVWGALRFDPTYYGGTTAGSADAYTCSNPSASGGGAYVDGETVTVYVDRSSTTTSPTLNVSGRGAAKIFSRSMQNLVMNITSTGVKNAALTSISGSGTTATATTTAPHGLTNGDQFGMTIAGVTPSTFNGTVLCTVTGASTFTYPNTTSGAASVAGNYSVNTRIGDILTFTFTNADFGTYAPTYIVQSTDLSIDTLGGHIGGSVGSLNADLTLTGSGIFVQNSGGGYLPVNCRTATTCAFGVSGSTIEACSPGTMSGITQSGTVGFLTINTAATFIYNTLLGGFIFIGVGGVTCGVPLEYIYEICTRANAGAWVCLNVIYTQAATVSLGAAMATNLPGLPVVCEYSNEVWNFGEFPVTQCNGLAACIGFGTSGGGYMDFYGLRTAQLLPAFASGWTGTGRPINTTAAGRDLELVNAMTPLEGSGGFTGQMVPLRWNGGCLSPTPIVATGSITATTLTMAVSAGAVPRCGMQVTGSGVTAGTVITKVVSGTQFTVNNSQSVASTTITITNPLYSALSGPGGTASSTAYNAFPTRPIDLVDGTSYATYVQGALAANNASSWTGTQSFYNTLFQASADYASGIPASMASAITAWSNDIRDGTKNGIRSSAGMSSFLGVTNAAGGNNFLPGWEAKVAVYDGARPSGKTNLSVRCYEGMIPQQSMSNSDGGVNLTTSVTDMTSC